MLFLHAVLHIVPRKNRIHKNTHSINVITHVW
jgi:hypothetical protein